MKITRRHKFYDRLATRLATREDWWDISKDAIKRSFKRGYQKGYYAHTKSMRKQIKDVEKVIRGQTGLKK